jgi:hypothetical protein
MGILVQRQFTVAMDDRSEFERQSRTGLWEDQRNNGSQMIGFGAWAFGGDSSVVVTHSAYADFGHWTATRGWGQFTREPERMEEAKHWRAIFAGRNRLIAHSSAIIYDYDDELSEPAPRWRNVGEDRVAAPSTYGPQSVIAETRFDLTHGATSEFRALCADTLLPWYRQTGVRPIIFGSDPLGTNENIVLLIAYPDITAWHQKRRPDTPDAAGAWDRRAGLIANESTRLLMVQTTFGTAAAQ